MSCCSSVSYSDEEVNGECPDCGGATVDGDAQDSCTYSPITCETCNERLCDGSC